MSTPNMLSRAALQPHLVNLVARLGRADVELAVGLLLDYIDAGRPATCRNSDELQEVQKAAAQKQGDRFHELRVALAAGPTSAVYTNPRDDNRWEQNDKFAHACTPATVAALLEASDWRPQFDVMVPKQEELAIQFCTEIVGIRGEGFRGVDPVRLLEMAQALYEAEREGIE